MAGPREGNPKISSIKDVRWTDVELNSAVASYLYAVMLELSGCDFEPGALEQFLIEALLKRRNVASIRYRMRNISSVFEENGWPTLSIYPPAHKVGTGVARRITEIASENSLLQLVTQQRRRQLGRSSQKKSSGESSSKEQRAVGKLKVLVKALNDLVGEGPGIGHNRPPEPIEGVDSLSADIIVARTAAEALIRELSKKTRRQKKVESTKHVLLSAGLKFSHWLGERATKFTDAVLKAAAVSAAAVLVAKVTHLMPILISAVAAIQRVIAGLPTPH